MKIKVTPNTISFVNIEHCLQIIKEGGKERRMSGNECQQVSLVYLLWHPERCINRPDRKDIQ